MNQEEKILRENIRQIIRLVKQKKNTEEDTLRQVVREFIDIEMQTLTEAGPDVDPTPNKSTGINVLEELLKKIIPIIETDYKSLTTNNSQRESYRSHIINAVVNSLTPAKINTAAGGVLTTNSKDLSSYTLITTGRGTPFSESFVLSLNALQKSMILSPA